MNINITYSLAIRNAYSETLCVMHKKTNPHLSTFGCPNALCQSFGNQKSLKFSLCSTVDNF